MIGSDHSTGADFSQAEPRHRFRTRRRLLDALLAEVLAPGDDFEWEATE
jgi:hypothetical protein